MVIQAEELKKRAQFHIQRGDTMNMDPRAILELVEELEKTQKLVWDIQFLTAGYCNRGLVHDIRALIEKASQP